VPQQAHNDYLELLAGGGVIGFAFGTWFVLTLVKHARERLRSKDPFRRAACLGALVGLFGIAVHCLTDFGLHVTINALVFVALVAVAVVPVGDEDQLAKSSQRFG
jgi:O-antigen ligase